jgi:hypothetical protein
MDGRNTAEIVFVNSNSHAVTKTQHVFMLAYKTKPKYQFSPGMCSFRTWVLVNSDPMGASIFLTYRLPTPGQQCLNNSPAAMGLQAPEMFNHIPDISAEYHVGLLVVKRKRGFS